MQLFFPLVNKLLSNIKDFSQKIQFTNDSSFSLVRVLLTLLYGVGTLQKPGEGKRKGTEVCIEDL